MTALDEVSFTCENGMVYGLIGPNGSGKSTCLRILAGLLNPSSGRVEFQTESKDDGKTDSRRKAGFVSASMEPYGEMTAWRFVQYCARMAKSDSSENRISETMGSVDALDYRERLCGELSTGMRRRVCIAGALVQDPAIMLLDEPTSGLDLLGRRDVVKLLETLKSLGKTVLFSTHIPDDIERSCDRVIVLVGGRILATGGPTELKAKTKSVTLEDAVLELMQHDE